MLRHDDADSVWQLMQRLPIEYVESAELRMRAWEFATTFDLPTLYDAAFLACAEMTPAPAGAIREFWTADDALLRALGSAAPAWVRHLREIV
ncbi:MAG TPA: type II toxin-antitoxin system VapC family toxin [Thermomicrobiales bacterium]|nr:type II toxin-antitoxin system VapC family toxin [Thermomicrobiales bacterium]